MDNLNIDAELSAGRLTLLVFLPDAVRSGLVGAIELWVHQRTSCAPVARSWVSYTQAALDQFYPGIGAQFPEGWPLFSRLFASGPCLATLWHGAEASRLLPSVKGATHPAHCSSWTIRGSFWCDNPTANLVHMSDDAGAAARELQILRELVPSLFVGNLSTQPLPPFQDASPPSPRHSGIVTLCALVATHLTRRERAFSHLELPSSGDARETMTRAQAWLRQVAEHTSTAMSNAVEAYLNATTTPSQLIHALKDEVTVDPWQELILRAALLSRDEWLKSSAADAQR